MLTRFRPVVANVPIAGRVNMRGVEPFAHSAVPKAEVRVAENLGTLPLRASNAGLIFANCDIDRKAALEGRDAR